MVKRLTLTILFSCVIILLSNVYLNAQAPYDISEYFPLIVGNSWAYQGYVVEEGFSQEAKTDSVDSLSCIKSRKLLGKKEMYLYEPDRNKKPIFYYSLSNSGISLDQMVEENRYLVFSPPLLFFPNGLQSNREHSVSASIQVYTAKNKLIDAGTVETKAKLKGVEDVVVPAGKFDKCLKIDFLWVFSTSRDTLIVKETAWFAHGIGKVKVKEELIRYREGRYHKVYNEKELKKATTKKVRGKD